MEAEQRYFAVMSFSVVAQLVTIFALTPVISQGASFVLLYVVSDIGALYAWAVTIHRRTAFFNLVSLGGFALFGPLFIYLFWFSAVWFFIRRKIRPQKTVEQKGIQGSQEHARV